MDRRTILAIGLSVLVYYVYMLWTGFGATPPETDTDAVAEVSGPEGDAPREVPAVAPAPVVEQGPASPLATLDLPDREVPFVACGAHGVFSTDGGVLHDVTLDDHTASFHTTPLWKWLVGLVSGGAAGGWSPYGDDPPSATLASSGAHVLAMGSGSFAAPGPDVELLEEADDRLVARGVTRDGIEVRRTLSVPGTEPCVVDVELSWTNRGESRFEGPLWVGMHSQLPVDDYEYGYGGRPTAMTDGSITTTHGLDSMAEPVPIEGPVQFFGLSDRYFSLMLIPDDEKAGTVFHTGIGEGDARQYGSLLALPGGLDAGGTVTQHYRMYLGPNDLDTLWKVDDNLGYLVDYGWFAVFSKPLLWLLKLYQGGVVNWGVAIILLTITVKGLFFPLTQMSFKSSQKMQALQPEIKKIKEQFKDNQEELNRRTMALFKEHGVNPLGGCLPMVVQMPVWIALYNVLLYSVELYHTEFLVWKDLSSVDPYNVLPLVVMGLMLLQQQLTPMGNLDPTQARMMKFMPLIFGLFFFTFPSGLVLYIFVNMCLTILQQWLIRRQYGTLPAVKAA